MAIGIRVTRTAAGHVRNPVDYGGICCCSDLSNATSQEGSSLLAFVLYIGSRAACGTEYYCHAIFVLDIRSTLVAREC